MKNATRPNPIGVYTQKMKTTLSQTDKLLPKEKQELLLWLLTEAKRTTL